MTPKNKPLKYKRSIAAAVAMISLTQSLYAQDTAQQIDWVRVDSNNSSMDITFSSANSGSFEFGKSVYLFHSAGSGGFYDAPNGPETNIDFNNDSANHIFVGESVSSSYTFNHLFTDAELPIFNAWQYNDYKVEVSGGDAVLSAENVTQGTSTNNDIGVEGVDYEIIGENTSTIILDKKSSENSTPTSGAFYGALKVTGSWSTIKFTQLFDNDTPREFDGVKSKGFDSLTRTRITGIKDAEIVPEPSSSLLLLCGAGLMLSRRQRS